jgi:hypothetical protein
MGGEEFGLDWRVKREDNFTFEDLKLKVKTQQDVFLAFGLSGTLAFDQPILWRSGRALWRMRGNTNAANDRVALRQGGFNSCAGQVAWAAVLNGRLTSEECLNEWGVHPISLLRGRADSPLRPLGGHRKLKEKMKSYNMQIGARIRSAFVALTAVLVLAFPPRLTEASIHEIVAAMCNGRGELEPYGQNKDGQSFVRALQATGFITSIEEYEGGVIIHFNPDIQASKYKSAGFDLLIEDGIAPGVDLILSPLVIPDEDFPAHANCHNCDP